MKTLLKALLIMQTFGWVPFLFLTRKSISLPITDLFTSLVFIVSISLLATSMLLFVALFSDRSFWKNVKQLEEKEIELQKMITEYTHAKEEFINKSAKLSNMLIKLEKKEE